jgi:hypothetical protein
MAMQDSINSGKILNHGWKKLRTIWKGVNAEYKAALTRYTMSGTHEKKIYDFCLGKIDVYYLRKNLDARPQLNDTVEADLPDDCAFASDDVESSMTGASSSKKSAERTTKTSCLPLLSGTSQSTKGIQGYWMSR